MPSILKITPILDVGSIEAEMPFWVDRLGFECVAQVPDGDTIGFAILKKDGSELMLQSTRSLKADLGTAPGGSALVYVCVPDLDEAEQAVGGAEIVVPRRKTFYGAHEIWVRSPGGHVVGLSQYEGE